LTNVETFRIISIIHIIIYIFDLFKEWYYILYLYYKLKLFIDSQ
jgi:hypothetical protein